MSTPIETFFARFASRGFRYCQSKSAHDNFQRLRQESKWNKDSKELKVARKGFDDALTRQFNFLFGKRADLASWRKLCVFIDITPVPNSIRQCRNLVWNAHVNLVDLVDCARTGKQVTKFATLEELKEYTKSDEIVPKKSGCAGTLLREYIVNDKIFPKKSAYAGALLKQLLREIFRPYHGWRRCRPESDKREKKKAGRKQAAAPKSS